MTNTTHTLGPWTPKFDESIRILDSNKAMLAIVTHLHLRGRRNAEEVAANARLIASAPDLLSVVMRCLYNAEHNREQDVWAMRSAIAKATGEE